MGRSPRGVTVTNASTASCAPAHLVCLALLLLGVVVGLRCPGLLPRELPPPHAEEIVFGLFSIGKDLVNINHLELHLMMTANRTDQDAIYQ